MILKLDNRSVKFTKTPMKPTIGVAFIFLSTRIYAQNFL